MPWTGGPHHGRMAKSAGCTVVPMVHSGLAPPIYTWRRMPLEGHWQRLHADPAQRSRRERRGLAALVTALGAVIVGVVLVVALGDPSGPQRGCLDATVASTTGGARLHVCGTDARRVCAGERGAPVRLDAALRPRCRALGLATRIP
jgi:hypothetical protein